ncbi:MAG: transporter substrate-binding domain-containing protein [bacterium]
MVTRSLLAALALMLATPLLLSAQQKIRAGIAGQPPFVEDGNPPSGASVDIWEKIAAENGWLFEYTAYDSMESGLKAVADGAIDILVGNAPINKDNLEKVEFSQPFFHSGLQILITDQQKTITDRLMCDVTDLLRLEIFWIITAAVVVLSAFVFFFERKHNPDFPKKTGEGIAEAFYYVITLALTGKSAYKGFPGILGRLVLIVWIILGIVTVAYVTSSITSAMTIEKLASSIESPRDLLNKTVAVIADSSAENYIAKSGIDEIPEKDIQEAVSAMLSKQASAVVADAAVLQAFDFNNPRIPVRVVGRVFQIENYGFAMPIGSPLRMPLNKQLVKLQESGKLRAILATYFGEANVQ